MRHRRAGGRGHSLKAPSAVGWRPGPPGSSHSEDPPRHDPERLCHSACGSFRTNMSLPTHAPRRAHVAPSTRTLRSACHPERAPCEAHVIPNTHLAKHMSSRTRTSPGTCHSERSEESLCKATTGFLPLVETTPTARDRKPAPRRPERTRPTLASPPAHAPCEAHVIPNACIARHMSFRTRTLVIPNAHIARNMSFRTQ